MTMLSGRPVWMRVCVCVCVLVCVYLWVHVSTCVHVCMCAHVIEKGFWAFSLLTCTSQ